MNCQGTIESPKTPTADTFSGSYNHNSVFVSVGLSIRELSDFSRIFLKRESITVVRNNEDENKNTNKILDEIVEAQNQKRLKRQQDNEDVKNKHENFEEFLKNDSIFIVLEKFFDSYNGSRTRRTHQISFNCRHLGIALAIMLPDLNYKRMCPSIRSQIDKILISNTIFQLDRIQPQPILHFETLQ